MKQAKSFSWMWFLFGLGSEMQLVASLSFTELAVLLWGPMILQREYPRMRSDGVSTLFGLSMLLVIGCMASCLYNQSPMYSVIRGLAITVIMCMSVPVAYAMLRRDPGGFKWMLVGSAISIVLCVFIFRKSVDLSTFHGDTEEMISGPLFWIQRFSAWITIPGQGWYLQMPLVVSMSGPCFLAAFALLTSTSGRSACLSSFASAMLCFIGGKSPITMQRICRGFWFFVFLGTLGIPLANFGYRHLAQNGYLGEEALKKYEEQTRGGTGVIKLLMGGRAESFMGLMACVDNPVFGLGPWAIDTEGYVREFLAEYGERDDYERCVEREAKGDHMIPCHSHIAEMWLWFGFPGLLYCLYGLFVFLRYLKHDCAAIPQWFMWVACSIPSLLWHIFFSPIGSRVTLPILLVACLLARSCRQGKFLLPPKMVEEILRSARR